MIKLLAFGFLVSLISILTEGSLLVMEEGTPNADDWRQLKVELLPAFSDRDGNFVFDRPVWTRTEGARQNIPFPVLGSLICDETVEYSVAARIDGVWQCVDINDPALPPANTTRKRSHVEADENGKVAPPATCQWDEAPLMYNVSAQDWQCVDPDRALMQYVKYSPRPPCNDTDLVVYNEEEDWFECKALALIPFLSTVSKDDLRWQVPSMARHIGIIAQSGRVRSGGFQDFRWSQYVFAASTETIAYDQTSPPQVVTSGGAQWLAYTITTSYVSYSGSNPYLRAVFNPVYPGSPTAYNTNITRAVPGSILQGNTMTFSPAIVTFNPSGTNLVNPVASTFLLNAANAQRSYGAVIVEIDVKVDAGQYPVVEIAESLSNWYAGTSPNYAANIHLVVAMWLRYEAPSGF